jgi:hypothetical protein
MTRTKRISPMHGIAFLALAGAAACAAEPAPDGDRTWSTPYLHTNVPWLESGAGDWFLIDTGSPRTQVLPASAGQAPRFSGEMSVSGLDLAGLYDGEPVLVSDELPARLRAAVASGEIRNLGGILGGDLLAKVPFAMDRDSSSIVFGGAAGDLAAQMQSVPVELLGGGGACLDDGLCYQTAASRLVAPVELAGVPMEALIDTAATYVMMPDAVLDRLIAADASIPQAVVQTPSEDVRLARIPLRWGEIERRVVVLALDGLGSSLARLHLETGRRVEMLLGQSLLHQFAVAFDYSIPTVAVGDREGASTDLEPIGLGLGVVVDGDCFAPVWLVVDGPASRAGVDLLACVTGIDGIGPGGPDAAAAAAGLDRLAIDDRVELRWRDASGEHEATISAADWLAD